MSHKHSSQALQDLSHSLPQSPGHLFMLLLQNPDALICISQMFYHLPDSTSCQCCSQYYCYLANDYGSFHLQWFDLVWWSWGWNPGPCQCLASVLPLRYIPSLRPLPANGLKSLPTHLHLYGWALLRLCFLNQMWSLRASTGTFIFFLSPTAPSSPGTERDYSWPWSGSKNWGTHPWKEFSFESLPRQEKDLFN